MARVDAHKVPEPMTTSTPPASDLEALLARSADLHKHLCPRQVLGVRMGLMAGRLLDLPLPQTQRKRLFVFMETDGCAADGVSVSTGCWVGHRTLRIIHFGKVAATFVDRATGAAIRLAPHPESRDRARQVRPVTESAWQAMMEGYQVLPDEELLVSQPVAFLGDLEAMISRPGARVMCEACGEEVLNDLQVVRDGRTLCRSCAGESYYRLLG
jgi:formylmethanofuran dehydrogenase subunit E